MGSFQGRGTASLMMVMMMMTIVSLCVSKGVLATNYKVGDGTWTIMSYDSWLSGKTFKVGDTLEFVYTSSHDVVQVTEADYGSCSPGSGTVKTDGDTTYNLSAAGSDYYICSFPTHCASGMKIAVTVEAASTPTTPTTPSTPSPSTNTTTPTPSTPSTTSPSNSSPLSLSSPFFTLLLSLGLSTILFFKS